MYPCMYIYIYNKVCIHLCMHKYCTQCKLGVHILSILEVARNDLGFGSIPCYSVVGCRLRSFT